MEIIERTSQKLKESAQSSLEKTVHFLQKFHIPLEIISSALIDYTAEFCVTTNHPNAVQAFEKALMERQGRKPK